MSLKQALHYVHRVDRAIPLASRDYLPYLLSLINEARHSVLATIFIVDPRPETDLGGNARLILDTLARAHWRGVDVRVIVGNSRQTPAIELADRVARRCLANLGVPCRPYAVEGSSGSLHSKYLVIDDVAVVGSHNWSHQSLCVDDELSLAVRSKDLSLRVRSVFEREWDRAAANGREAATGVVPVAVSEAHHGTEPTGLRAALEKALATWAATWHPALTREPAQVRLLGAILYQLASLVGGEPLDVSPLVDLDGLSAYAVMAADQGLRRYLGEQAGALGAPDGPPVSWVDEGEVPLGGGDGPPLILQTSRPLDPAPAGKSELDPFPGIGPVLVSRIGESESLGESLVADVRRAVETAASYPVPGAGPFILPERAAYLGRLAQRAAVAGGGATAAPTESTVAWAGLVSRSAYPDVALRLLRSAKREVSVVVFLHDLPPGRDSPGRLPVPPVPGGRGIVGQPGVGDPRQGRGRRRPRCPLRIAQLDGGLSLPLRRPEPPSPFRGGRYGPHRSLAARLGLFMLGRLYHSPNAFRSFLVVVPIGDLLFGYLAWRSGKGALEIGGLQQEAF